MMRERVRGINRCFLLFNERFMEMQKNGADCYVGLSAVEVRCENEIVPKGNDNGDGLQSISNLSLLPSQY
jgi:hypothetical protein